MKAWKRSVIETEGVVFDQDRSKRVAEGGGRRQRH